MPKAIYLDDLAVGRKFVTQSTTLTLEGIQPNDTRRAVQTLVFTAPPAR